MTFNVSPNVFVPSAETYVKSALATLPYSRRTCGYWSHGFQVRTLTPVLNKLWVRYTLWYHTSAVHLCDESFQLSLRGFNQTIQVPSCSNTTAIDTLRLTFTPNCIRQTSTRILTSTVWCLDLGQFVLYSAVKLSHELAA